MKDRVAKWLIWLVCREPLLHFIPIQCLILGFPTPSSAFPSQALLSLPYTLHYFPTPMVSGPPHCTLVLHNQSTHDTCTTMQQSTICCNSIYLLKHNPMRVRGGHTTTPLCKQDYVRYAGIAEPSKKVKKVNKERHIFDHDVLYR